MSEGKHPAQFGCANPEGYRKALSSAIAPSPWQHWKTLTFTAAEFSSDLLARTAATAADLEVAAPATPVNATTEIVHLRLTPPLSPSHTRKSVRLRVSTP